VERVKFMDRHLMTVRTTINVMLFRHILCSDPYYEISSVTDHGRVSGKISPLWKWVN
jgi:hypothetical protein